MIIPFKNRELDETKPVQVYRNLNRKGVWYSVKQEGYVIGHTQYLNLCYVTFKINKSGKQRAIKTRQRNVHAYVEGLVNKETDDNCHMFVKVSYNPFSELGFNIPNPVTKNPEEVEHANDVQFSIYGCYIVY